MDPAEKLVVSGRKVLLVQSGAGVCAVGTSVVVRLGEVDGVACCAAG